MVWIGLVARKTASTLIIFSLQKVSIEHSKIPSWLAQSRMEKASPLVRNTGTGESSGTGAGELDAAVGLAWDAAVGQADPGPRAWTTPGSIAKARRDFRGASPRCHWRSDSQDRPLRALAEANVHIATCSIICPILLQSPPEIRPIYICSHSSLGHQPGAAADCSEHPHSYKSQKHLLKLFFLPGTDQSDLISKTAQMHLHPSNRLGY